MGRTIGGALIVIGLGLWYYGGVSGVTPLVNLGIGSIILGLVLATLPLRGQVDRDSIPMVCASASEFLSNLKNDLELRGSPIVIPPFENLPRGGIFLPKSEEVSISLGKLDEKTVFVTGPEQESGVLITPPLGWDILDYAFENIGDLRGSGIGYASSAISSVLSGMGLGSAEVFEGEGKVEVFVSSPCGGSVCGDPVVSAVLLSVAIGSGELFRVLSTERKGEYIKVVLEPLGRVERWL